MWNQLKTLMTISALCLGSAALPANASENRSTDFAIPCDNQTHTVFFTVTGLGTASTRFIQGAEISVLNPSGLTFLTLGVTGTQALDLITLGAGNSHQSRDFTGFYSVPISNGTLQFQITGACNPKSGDGPKSGDSPKSGSEIHGIAVIGFFI